MGPPVTLPSSLVGIREAIKGNSDSEEMQRTATAGFYAGFVGQGIEYTQIISKADYQLSLLIVTQKGLNAAANPLTYVEYFRNFSPQEKLEAAKRTAKGAWNGDYDSALGRKTGAAILDYLLVAIGGALMKGESAACEVAESGSGSVKNWKGQEVKIPDGHIMSSRDPDFSEPPIYREGPYTDAQRNAFLQGKSGDTKTAPHHRHQISVRDGGVIDEIPGPGHPEGNQHTGGSPNRHPNSSIFNSESNGNRLRNSEIRAFWKAKGKRLIPDGRGGWIDPRY